MTEKSFHEVLAKQLPRLCVYEETAPRIQMRLVYITV